MSQIDPTLAVAVGGGVVSVPGLSKRRARTNVELRDGQSFAIAGLLQTQSTRTIDQLPGSAPARPRRACSAARHSRTTRPNSWSSSPGPGQSAKPGQVLASPLDTTLPANDVDLFVNGKTEIARDTRTLRDLDGGRHRPPRPHRPGPRGEAVPSPCAEPADVPPKPYADRHRTAADGPGSRRLPRSLSRRSGHPLSASGDAVHANIAKQVIDPWPPMPSGSNRR